MEPELIIATGNLSGHEARASVTIKRTNEGTLVLTLADLWIAPGAPDVRIYLNTNANGIVDDSSHDLGTPASGSGTLRMHLPQVDNPEVWASVTVYCKVYSVLFGFARLSWS